MINEELLLVVKEERLGHTIWNKNVSSIALKPPSKTRYFKKERRDDETRKKT